MANCSAVQTLSARHPLIKNEIKEVSKKFQRRWSRWPEGGTFDKGICGEVDILLRGYKEQERGQRTLEKRERERIILDMFKHGDQWGKTQKVMQMSQGEIPHIISDKTQTMPSQGENTQGTASTLNTGQGQLPLLSGTIEFSGLIDVEEEQEQEQQPRRPVSGVKEGGKAKRPEREPAPSPHTDCYHDMKAARDKELWKKDRVIRLSHAEFMSGGRIKGEEKRQDSIDQARWQSYKAQQAEGASPYATGRSRRDKKYADPPSVPDSDWDEDEEFVTRSEVNSEDEVEYEEAVGSHTTYAAPSIVMVHHKAAPPPAPWLPKWDPGTQTHDTRASPEPGPSGVTSRKKKAKSVKYQAPVLVKGGDMCYEPWGWIDMENMILALPSIISGASKWIRVFEERTMGKLLAVGDVTALLARVLGKDKLRSVLEEEGLEFLLRGIDFDGVLFDVYRRETWRALRKEYPSIVDPEALQGRALRGDEHPAVYLQEQVVRWRTETEKDPETDRVLSMLFRTSIMEGLPSSVKSKLEDVVGLKTSKSHKEFSDHLVHAMDRYRRNENKIHDQNKEVQRKLFVLQLHDLTQEQEKKKQGGVENSGMMVQLGQQATPPVPHVPQATAPVNMGAPALQPPLTLAPQPGAQVSPNGPPMVNVYQSTGPPPNNYNRQARGGGMPGQFRYTQRRRGNRGGPLVCWGCNQLGHMRAQCQINPYPSPNQYYAQGQGQGYPVQPEQGQTQNYPMQQGQGPFTPRSTGPWMGQGY